MKALPYILIVLVLLVGGGAYLYLQKPSAPIVNIELGPQTTKTTDNPTLNEDQLFVNNGAAPDFTGGNGWLNGEATKIAALRGTVVLVDFWTYSSINSIRTLPYLTKWQEQYKDKGFAIIGVHTPQFAFEKVQGNIEAAIKRYNINFPVILDNNYKIWNAYNNQFWPALYLVDKDGNIVYTHFGEGNYEVTERAIRTLLGMEGPFDIPVAPPIVNKYQTPDINLGLTKLSAFGGAEKPSGDNQIYTFPEKLAKNKFALEGNWAFTQEAAVHTKGFGRIKLSFNAAKVYMVGAGDQPVTLKIYVDGQLVKGVVVSGSELYELYNSAEAAQHTMEIEVPEPGFKAFAFTFES